MNILVTGANGQLGNELRRLAKGGEHNFVFSDVTDVQGVETMRLDICDEQAVIAACAGKDVIINCAAYTNVDAAESNIELADMLNHRAPGILAEASKQANAVLIHISTDYVFDGQANSPYKESDAPCPRSVYGSTKLSGERSVRESGCRYIILRTAWLYSPYGKNFVKTIGGRCMTSESLKVVSDQYGSPTCAADLASAIMHIINSKALDRQGIYHFTDEGETSWFEFARTIAEMRASACRIIPCTSEEYPSPVKRPHYSVLDKSLFKSTFHYQIPEWRESLRKCIDEIWK